MNRREISWSLIICWALLSIFGLIAIYSATQGPVSQFLDSNIQDSFYKQFVWVAVGAIILVVFQFITPKSYVQLSYFLYGIGIVLLLLTFVIGVEVNGAKSWIRLGPMNFQSSEFMKVATVLATANYLTSRRNISVEKLRYALVAVLMILVPTILVILQNDLGSAIIFVALIPVMLFWSGLPYGISLLIISPAIMLYLTVLDWKFGVFATLLLSIIIFVVQKRTWITAVSLVMGIAVVQAVQFALDKVLQPHQISRITAFANPDFDPTGAGWNVIQAKTAIGSGGLTGKGFLEGTQTQLRFLPAQWTDFIACVIGEEFGFIGLGLLIVVFIYLFIKLLNIAGNHKHPYAQLVIVSITSIFFVHFMINIGSATALLPVIGLPLPFVSYGGSSFMINSLMLAICINMDMYKRDFSIYR